MLARRVDVRMAENISDEINIAGFVVKRGAIRAAQLVWTDFSLERRGDCRVFLHEVFDCPLRNPPPLQRKEQRALVSRQNLDIFALRQIRLECVGDFVGIIQNHFLAALARDEHGVFFKVQVIDVQPDAFAHTDARAEQQRENGHVARARMRGVRFLALSKAFAAFGGVEQPGDFVRLQPNDFLRPHLRQRHKGCDISRNVFMLKEIIVKRAQRAELAHLSGFRVFNRLIGIVFIIKGKIIRVAFQIGQRDLPQRIDRDFGNAAIGKTRDLAC